MTDAAPRSPSQQTSEADVDGSRTSLSPLVRPVNRRRRRGTSSQGSDHPGRPRSRPRSTDMQQEPPPPGPMPLLWTRESHPLSDGYPTSQLSQPIPDHLQLPSLWNGPDGSLPLPGPDALLSPPGIQKQPETNRRFPLEDVQEACLMRYYVEELSHWVALARVIPYYQLTDSL
jgi:hypothetical protein